MRPTIRSAPRGEPVNKTTAQESMANARLMVAAPDLLDALTTLLAALDDVPVAFGVHVHDAIEAANEAIAKTSGTWLALS